MKIVVNLPFASRKTAHDWLDAGMRKESANDWLRELGRAIQPHKDHLSKLIKDGIKIKVHAAIYGKPNQIKQLDIHDALAQIADQVTDVLFPRQKGKTTPQTEDRHFWQVYAEKIIAEKPKVEIEVEELT